MTAVLGAPWNSRAITSVKVSVTPLLPQLGQTIGHLTLVNEVVPRDVERVPAIDVPMMQDVIIAQPAEELVDERAALEIIGPLLGHPGPS